MNDRTSANMTAARASATEVQSESAEQHTGTFILSEEEEEDSSVFFSPHEDPTSISNRANQRRKRVPIAKKIHKTFNVADDKLVQCQTGKEKENGTGSKSCAPLALSEASLSVEDAPSIPGSVADILISRSSGDGQEESLIESPIKWNPIESKKMDAVRMTGGMEACSSCCTREEEQTTESSNTGGSGSKDSSRFVFPRASDNLPIPGHMPLKKHSRSISGINVMKEFPEETKKKKKMSRIQEVVAMEGHHPPHSAIEPGMKGTVLYHAQSSVDVSHKPSLAERADSKIENFLVGPGGSALLGKEELLAVLPDQKVKVFLGTWNIASLPVNEDLTDGDIKEWLKEGMAAKAHIFALGIQEGPILDSSFPEDLQERIQHCLGDTLLFLVSEKLGVQVLMLFIHRSLIWFVSVPSTDSVRTNSANVLQYCAKTKGAVAVVFRLFRTSMLFISCHLSYGVKSDGRVQDYKKIVQNLRFKDYPLKKGAEDVVGSYDNVFWIGDLNFKLEQERSTIEALMLRAPVMVESILHKDQLKREIKSGSIFHGFHEHEIKFHPTYKYDIGTNKLDSSSKNRVPAYTDRILYKRNVPKKEGKMESIKYHSAHAVCFSDHKPVFSVLRFPVKPGATKLPTAGASPRKRKKSNVCGIM